ncbi:MAG: hypothetical protein KC553_08180 [Nitrospina sp.]|nr:hypothetical protein [Nitrospina sp.]
MGRKLKDFLVDLLAREEGKNAVPRSGVSTGNGFGLYEDEAALTEEVPYKLEPDLSVAEQYIDRIRRQGW